MTQHGEGPRREAVRALVRMVTESDLDATRARLRTLDAAQARLLTAAARRHGLEAWLAACAPKTPEWTEATAQRAAFLASQMRQRQHTRTLFAALRAEGCDVVLLKGLGIALSAYPRADLRYSVDIDLLVRPRDLERAIAVLERSRFDLIDVNWPVLRERMPGALRLRSADGTIVDLHWHLMNYGRLRAEFDLDTDELIDRRVPVPDEPGLAMLEPADQVLHIALHAALAGANRLVWLVDLDRSVRSLDVNWPLFVERVEAGRCGPPVALSLIRARRLFETPLPADLVAELPGGPAMRRSESGLRLASIVRFDPARPGLARATARASRSTWVRSQRGLARSGVEWLRTRAAGADRAEAWRDPTQVHSTLFPVDDQRARADYFRAVRERRE